MSNNKGKNLAYIIVGVILILMGIFIWNKQHDKDDDTPPEPADQPTVVSNPPTLKKNAKGEYDLIMAYKTAKLFNPNTQLWDAVQLRGYLTKPELFANKQAGDFVEDILNGPQIRAKQGETIKLNLLNQLPVEDQATCPDDVENINEPHCFNTTNLHTHGLWVSPQGNSDNVFLTIKPKENVHYQFKIEDNHPAGTFWYHSHVHGSTALQVSSGMAGALIIEGSRKPEFNQGKITKTGDMDILWKDSKFDRYSNDKVLVFQQIQYDCLPQDEVESSSASPGQSTCKGVLENYTGLANPNSWGTSQRYTSINGKVLGELKVEQNQFNRWRMIHGGIRDTVALTFKELPDSTNFTSEQTIAACSAYQSPDKKNEFEQLKTLTVNTIAQDGLTMDHLQTRSISVFQPGYRHDAMIAFPSTNKYCVFDRRLNADDQINAPFLVRPTIAPSSPLNAQLIAWVNVQPSKLPTQTATQYLESQAQKIGLSKDIAQQLGQGNLSAFIDHATLMTPELDQSTAARSKQFTAFSIDLQRGPKFGVKHEQDGPLLSFGDAFSGTSSVANQYVRQLPINQTQEWEITSDFVGHPFHIHVNPFQIVKILDRNGNDVSSIDNDIKDIENDGTVDIQYRGLKGLFKDTLFIKQGYRIFVRSHYKKFEGDFVMHCHILDHEDQGMMEINRICGDKFPCDSPLPSHQH